jgi:hypothetical protein
MRVATVTLDCFGGSVTPGAGGVDPDVQIAVGTVDLGTPSKFVAWCSIGYVNGLGPPLDFHNAIVAEVYTVDNVTVPISAYDGKLTSQGGFQNMHQIAYAGQGQFVQFRLRVFQPKALEASMAGIVLYDF